MNGKLLHALLVLCLGLWACTAQKQGQDKPEVQAAATAATASVSQAKNIILMIGDGMGVGQLTAGMYVNNNRMAVERMPVVGLHKSHSYDDLVTDSAAGATAFSCGIKTYNGAIGVFPDTTACKTILESFEDAGLQTGLVATSTIVHATPASFYGHTDSRRSYEELAYQLSESGIDFFFGGGAKFFERRTSDTQNLVESMNLKGWSTESYFHTPLENVKPLPGKRYAYMSADEDPLPVSGGRNYLERASELAIDYLDASDTKDEGFFLMIEASQIDWGGHANNTEYIISETIEFSSVIDRVLDFAQRDGNTLVIVTADHETGGFAINKGSRMDSINGKFTSDYHTAAMIPVFAYGPGSQAFAGIYENTEIYHKMMAAKGFPSAQ